jgi:Ca-activated chloride channel homolog
MKFTTALIAMIATSSLIACTDLGNFGSPSVGSGGFGATQGGVQDMGLARELVKNNKVPPKEAFLVEGMFSEHDLPLSGAACPRVLCLRGGLGWAPTLEGSAAAWVQVGFSSTIDPATFKRPNLELTLVIDISGSMDAEYKTKTNEYARPLATAKTLARRIVNELTEADRLGIVLFGSEARVFRPLAAVTNKSDLLNAIDSLQTEGATNLEAGLQTGYELLSGSGKPGVERRVMVFTDANPNVGATQATQFQTIAGAAAKRGVGLTVFTFGVGTDQAVTNALSNLRGGNAFSAFSATDTEDLMRESWPWMTVPIAHDLLLKLEPSNGFKLEKGYGFPEGTEGLNVASIFLSKKRGGVLVRFDASNTAPPQPALAQFKLVGKLAYTTPNGEAVSEDLNLTGEGLTLDAKGRYSSQPATAKAIALTVLVTGMRDAASDYATNHEKAVATMTKTLERFKTDTQLLNDASLTPELEFASKLLELMKQGASQGNLYGQ